MNLAACAGLPTRIETATWYRAVQPKYYATALSTAYTSYHRSRYSQGIAGPTPYEILYLSENHLVAQFEVGALFGDALGGYMMPAPALPLILFPITVHLQYVVDLTEVAHQQLLDTTAQELTGDWRGYHLRAPGHSVIQPVGAAPTQDLGAALFAVPRLEGFRTISAKVPHSCNLVVFPQKLATGSHLTFINNITGTTESIPWLRVSDAALPL